RRDIRTHQFAIHPRLAHPPGDELGILRTKVQNRDDFIVDHSELIPWPRGNVECRGCFGCRGSDDTVAIIDYCVKEIRGDPRPAKPNLLATGNWQLTIGNYSACRPNVASQSPNSY